MYHRVRRKMRLVVCAILILVPSSQALPAIEKASPQIKHTTENYETNVIDFDDEFSVKFNNKYDVIPWGSQKDKYARDSHKYTIVTDDVTSKTEPDNKTEVEIKSNLDIIHESTTETDYSVIPLELVSTSENYLQSIVESTTDPDLSVIPLTKVRSVPNVEIDETITLPTSTQETDTTTDIPKELDSTTETPNTTTIIVQTTLSIPNTTHNVDTHNDDNNTDTDKTTTEGKINTTTEVSVDTMKTTSETPNNLNTTAKEVRDTSLNANENADIKAAIDSNDSEQVATTTVISNENSHKNISISNKNATISNKTDTFSKVENKTLDLKANSNTPKSNATADIVADLSKTNSSMIDEILTTNSSKRNENVTDKIDSIEEDEKDVPIFTELDAEDEEVPEDYYDSKDVVPTTPPKTSALSVLVGLAGSVVESVAEKVVPKGIFDLFKRMQRQSEALEAERLRSREENGGLGQFGRGILKSISSGLSKPLSQLMAGAKDIGSLDSDRGFVGSLASGVSSVATVATSLADAFKDRVQAIYPGTVWCGDGHSPTARSGELGLFFFTDTCCRQHDACKLYIRAGETKYGLTNTGLFTRSHCSCDAKFRACLRRTNSLVSGQIGLTYFNVLGPQCFRRAHPIVKCVRRTRITGQKCEEYEYDYTKPKMWQWFDNETF